MALLFASPSSGEHEPLPELGEQKWGFAVPGWSTSPGDVPIADTPLDRGASGGRALRPGRR